MATMAEAAGAPGAVPLLYGLPDEISIWEILVRLSPKDVLRCRAVSPAWRRATSIHDFLLAHHARQPTLPLLCGFNSVAGNDDQSLDIIPFDHRAGLTAADQLHSVARLQRQRPDLGNAGMVLLDSCDGLLCLYNHNRHYAICNPVTRQYAPLWQIDGFTVLGMYPHRPTGEYRLLLYPDFGLMDDEQSPPFQDGCHVVTLGSCQPPRHIGWPEARELISETNVLFRGSLHWYPVQPESQRDMIMVFDTAAESFRRMRAPVLPGDIDLFEMDGMLVMASPNDAATVIAIWVLEDYESEVWTFKWQVELPVTEIRVRCEKYDNFWDLYAVPADGEFFVLVRFNNCLLQVDMDGKLVATFHRRGLVPNKLHLKQTLVQHSFFPTLEGYVVNGSPFI